MAVKLTPRARQDLREIYTHHAQYDAQTAERTLRELDAAFQLLDRFPLSGRARSALREGLRSFPKSPHVIFYSIAPPDIIIARVLNERMDIDTQDL